MKKTLIIIAFVLFFIILYFLQTNFFIWYNIAGVKPNIFIIFTLFIGLFLGHVYGFSLGVVFGIILDLFIGKCIGLNAIMLSIAGFAGGILDKSFSKDSRIAFMLMTIVITILCEIINYTMQILILNVEPLFMNFMKIVIIEAIYNAIVVIIIYPLIQKLGNKTEEIFKEKNTLMRYY